MMLQLTQPSRDGNSVLLAPGLELMAQGQPTIRVTSSQDTPPWILTLLSQGRVEHEGGCVRAEGWPLCPAPDGCGYLTVPVLKRYGWSGPCMPPSTHIPLTTHAHTPVHTHTLQSTHHCSDSGIFSPRRDRQADRCMWLHHKEKVGGQERVGETGGRNQRDETSLGTGPEPHPHLHHMGPMEMASLLA
jgi:hypothetical protein